MVNANNENPSAIDEDIEFQVLDASVVSASVAVSAAVSVAASVDSSVAVPVDGVVVSVIHEYIHRWFDMRMHFMGMTSK